MRDPSPLACPCLLVCASLIGLAAPAALAQDFGPGARLTTKARPESAQRIRAVDVDMDGHLDLTWLVGEGSVLTVALNDGHGGFWRSFDVARTGFRTSGPSSAGLERVVWIDHDGDGDRDLVIPGSATGAGSILATVHRNDGAGSFTPIGALDPDVPAPPSRALDMDGDGDADLLIESDPAGLLWCENLGGGDFASAALLDVGAPITVQRQFFGPRDAAEIRRADVDGDGIDDLFWNTPSASWARGLGGASYAPAVDLSAAVPMTLASLIDFEGDGDLDCVFVPLVGTPRIHYRENDGAGSFGTPRASSLLPFVASARLLVEDLDGDGDADVVATDRVGHGPVSLTAFLQDGSGAFTPTGTRSVFAPGPDLIDVAVAGVRPNGLADVFVGQARMFGLRIEGPAALDLSEAARLLRLEPPEFLAENGFGTGDLDRDGLVEVVRTAPPIQTIEAIGGPEPRVVEVELETGEVAHAHPLATDIDADGDQDLVVGVIDPQATTSALYLFVNEAPRRAPILLASWPAADAPNRILAGDGNGDGVTDLLVESGVGSACYGQWLVQGAGGGFSPGPRTLLWGSADLPRALLDVDGDGDDDTLYIRWPSNDVVWNETDATQGLLPASVLLPADDASSIAIADLDGDGDDDLVASLGEEGVVRFANEGSGRYRRVQRLHPDRWQGVVAGDIDLDGDEDIVLRTSDRIVSFENDGTGRLLETASIHAPSLSAHWHAPRMRLSDVDGDGDLDLARVGVDLMIHLNDLRLGEGFCLGSGDGPAPRPRLVVRGSEAVADDDLELGAEGLTPGAVGVFLVASERALSPAAGGLAPLCLAGPALRLDGPGQVQAAGPDGRVALTVGVATIGAAAGETLHVQRWTRDGAGGSGFTSGISVTFR